MKYVTLDNSLGALTLSKQDLHMEQEGSEWNTNHNPSPTQNLEPFSGSPHTPWGNILLACSLERFWPKDSTKERQGEQHYWS